MRACKPIEYNTHTNTHTHMHTLTVVKRQTHHLVDPVRPQNPQCIHNYYITVGKKNNKGLYLKL